MRGEQYAKYRFQVENYLAEALSGIETFVKGNEAKPLPI
jgi:hypothetical protein